MGKIEQLLVEAGATNISKAYNEDKTCTAIMFQMTIDSKFVYFKLPANVQACFEVLWSAVKNKLRANKQLYIDQAHRTAWKIILDWVEVQLAMIQLDQAKPLQIFLPYVCDPHTGQTFYEKIESNPKLLPGAG